MVGERLVAASTLIDQLIASHRVPKDLAPNHPKIWSQALQKVSKDRKGDIDFLNLIA